MEAGFRNAISASAGAASQQLYNTIFAERRRLSGGQRQHYSQPTFGEWFTTIPTLRCKRRPCLRGRDLLNWTGRCDRHGKSADRDDVHASLDCRDHSSPLVSGGGRERITRLPIRSLVDSQSTDGRYGMTSVVGSGMKLTTGPIL